MAHTVRPRRAACFECSSGIKTFKPYTRDQLLLLLPALRGWPPEGHLAVFISDVADGVLDLPPILGTYMIGDGQGQFPYHPAHMVKLLLYG